MLPRKYTSLGYRQVKKILKQGQIINSRLGSLFWLKNDQPHSRLAVVVSKKISKKAVLRNTLRRKIKAMARELIISRKDGRDFVFLCRKNALEATTAEIKKEITQMFLM